MQTIFAIKCVLKAMRKAHRVSFKIQTTNFMLNISDNHLNMTCDIQYPSDISEGDNLCQP